MNLFLSHIGILLFITIFKRQFQIPFNTENHHVILGKKGGYDRTQILELFGFQQEKRFCEALK